VTADVLATGPLGQGGGQGAEEDGGHDATVVDAVRRHAAEAPRRTALRWVAFPGGDPVVTELDYAGLDRAARRLAAWLQARCTPGDRVLLAHGEGLDAAVAYLGCLYAGVAPLHPALPRRSRAPQSAGLVAALRDADVALVLTDGARRERAVEVLTEGGLEHLPVVVTDGVVVDGLPVDSPVLADHHAWTPPPLRPDSPAFLQYTSGSTDDPKGVTVTHGGLAHNARSIIGLARGHRGETFCGWLPLHHDMGLVGQLLTPLYAGGTTVMMAPTDFVRHPVRWLELIGRYGAGYTAAPNFALDLCCLRVDDARAATLDLSSLQVLLAGAEPLDAATLARFTERFAPAGLRPDAVKPAYGLAESTLMVTATPRAQAYRTATVDARGLQRHRFAPVVAVAPEADGRAAPDTRVDAVPVTLVSCGPAQGMRVAVVDPRTAEPLPEGHVGEVWVAGPSLAAGYWRRPDLTRETFRAVTADGDGPWLRTGDLGALHDGELYVTGRLKEVLVVHGRTLYPYDAERSLAALHPSFDGLGSAVFSVPGRGEEVVAVQELRPAAVDRDELPGLARAVAEELGRTLGLAVNVVLVAAGSIRRTTSGKVQRLAMREDFVAGRVRPVGEHLSAAVRERHRRDPDGLGGSGGADRTEGPA